MRPVEKDGLPPDPSGLPLVTFLLQKLGPYCSFCERPLPDECWLWNKNTGFALSSQFLPITQELVDWDQLLILDRNCAYAHQQREAYYRQRLRGQLLMPDEAELSFRRGEKSPIQYSLKRVTLVVVDEYEKEVLRRDDEVVLAIGLTDEAIRTIEHFGLNTRYYSQATNEFRIPDDEYYSAYDRRVRQRTDVWHMAGVVERLIADTRESEFQTRLRYDEARLTIAAAGFLVNLGDGSQVRFPTGLLLNLRSSAIIDWIGRSVPTLIIHFRALETVGSDDNESYM